MALFERGYRAAAKTELEREIREIEDKDKAAQTKEKSAEADTVAAATAATNNVAFAERLRLISAQEANDYRQRIRRATAIHEERERMRQVECRTDDYENPVERANRYMDMEEYKGQIAQARAHEDAAQTSKTRSEPEKTTEEDERTR